jgi:hypothetical protein
MQDQVFMNYKNRTASTNMVSLLYITDLCPYAVCNREKKVMDITYTISDDKVEIAVLEGAEHFT